jgi:hypothetical protein
MYIVFGVDSTHIRCIKNISDVRRVETLYRRLVAPTARIRWSYVFPTAFVNTLEFGESGVHDTTVYELGKKFNMWLYDQVKIRCTIAREYIKPNKVKEVVPDKDIVPVAKAVPGEEVVPDKDVVHDKEVVPEKDVVPVPEVVPNKEVVPVADVVPDKDVVPVAEVVPNKEVVPVADVVPDKDVVPVAEVVPNKDVVPVAYEIVNDNEKILQDIKDQIKKVAKYFKDENKVTNTDEPIRCDPEPFSIVSYAFLCDSVRDDGHCAFKPRKLAAQTGITTIYACPMAMEREFLEKTPVKDVLPKECYVLVKVSTKESIAVFDDTYLPFLDNLTLYGIDPAIITDIKTFPSAVSNLQNIVESIAIPSNLDEYLYRMYTGRKFLSCAKPAKSKEIKRILETMYGHYEVTLDRDAGMNVIDVYLQHKKNHSTEMSLCTFIEVLDYLGFLIKEKRVLYLKKCMFPHLINLVALKTTHFEPLDSTAKITQLRRDPRITHAPWSFHQAWMLSSKAMIPPTRAPFV